MRSLDRFKNKMNYSGGSLRNEHILNGRNLLDETFSDDPSFTLGIYFWQLGIKDYSDKQTIKIRLYNKAFSSANGVTMKFQTLYNTPVDVGDIVYDSKTSEYLICTESFNIHDIHWEGKFTLCNWILKWQKKDGTILEYPCHDINSTQYNSGEESNKQFTIGSSQHMITLPCDENTVKISTPQRFYLDKDLENPTSFIVTQNDTTSYNYGKKGLVRVTLYEHAKNSEADRPDLGICDYIDIKSIKTDNAENKFVSKSVISYETAVIKSGGDAQVFTGKFYDNIGNEIAEILPKWTVICDFKDYLEIKETENQISIGIDNDDYIDEEFKLILSDNLGQYTSTLLVSVESLL